MANQVKIKDKIVSVGDLVRISTLLIEGGKSRLYPFEGLVIAIKGREENKSFTVRKIGVGGIGIERSWPVASPWIEKVEIKKEGRVRRAKLYYLRKRTGRLALKVKSKEKANISTKKRVRKAGLSKVKKEPRVAKKKARQSGRESNLPVSSA